VSPRRIALVCSGLGRIRRGFERFTEDLARALSPHADVRVFAGRRPAGLRGMSIPCAPRQLLERIGMNAPRAYYWEQVTFGAALWPALLAFRPDVVHFSDGTIANVYLRARRLLPGRPPFVFCNSGNLTPEHWRRYDHVQLTADWQTAPAREAGVDPAMYSVVPLGTNAAKFRLPMSREEARARLGLPDGLLAISVASLDKSVKCLDYVINEVASAPGWNLVCLGERTLETPELEALAERVAPGRVRFPDVPTKDVPLYLAAADVFLLASKSEGFGLALVEAMCAGLPAIVRDIPASRYLLEDDEQTLRFEPGTLASALEHARDTTWRAATGAKNAARAGATFDWTALVPQYLALYERVIDRPEG